MSTRFLIPAAAVCSLLLARNVHAADTTFTGPPTLNIGDVYPWSTFDNWSSGIPSPGDDATIQERPDSPGQFSYFGPFLDVDANVGSLTMVPYTDISNQLNGVSGKSLVVTGTTDMNGFMSNVGGTYTLGTLAQFNTTTKTISGTFSGFLVSDGRFGGQTLLSFRGADIVTNSVIWNLWGSNSLVRDQNTGLDAFRNLAFNTSSLSLQDGYEIGPLGNFTNQVGAQISLNTSNNNPRTPAFRIAGNFTNNGTVRLGANSIFIVNGGLSGTGSITVTGLPCVLNVLGTYEVNGGLNLGGSGVDGFILKAIANVGTGGTISGNGTVEGGVTVTTGGSLAPGNSAGTIKVAGNLSLAAGARLQMEISGSEHDSIIQTTGAGGTVLGGELEVTTIGDFDDEILVSSFYDIVTSHLPLSGSFTNVASGSRLTTTSGKGSFLVRYGPGAVRPDRVRLSDYVAVNPTQSFSSWIEEEQGVTAPDNDPDDDPNADGITNLEAYFRGIPAIGPSKPTGLEFSHAGSGEDFITTLRGARTVIDVTLTSETSTDLIRWIPGPTPQIVTSTPTRDIYEVMLPDIGSQFVRFKVEQHLDSED